MKTPSFFELKTLVEYLSDELCNSQLQEVMSTQQSLVLSFYRFHHNQKICFLVFDLDKTYPFLGFFNSNPWAKHKESKPVSLFLNAHGKNHYLSSIEISENLGRVIKFSLGGECSIEFRLIPKQTNIIITHNKKTISWYPVKALAQNDLRYASEQASSLEDGLQTKNSEEIRSISFMMDQWLRFRGAKPTEDLSRVLSPFEKWKKNKEKDKYKKQKALSAIEEQINKFNNEEWAQVGEYLKVNGFKSLKPEWTIYIDFEKSISFNIQNCFEKAKVAKVKVKGAFARLETLKLEIAELSELTTEKYEDFLSIQNSKKNKATPRKVEGRLRKIQIQESGIVAYMGKSAADNLDLLRRSKPYDLWLHLKDYPSSHAIIHKNKDQKVSDTDINKIATWFLKEGLSDKKRQIGGKFVVIVVECRHVRPLKGDKLGRVSYHNAREILIAV